MLNINSNLCWKSHYTLEVFRPNWLGRLVARWRRGGLSGLPLRTLRFLAYSRGSVEADNIIPTEGRNSILNVAFNAATQITAWYLSVFANNYTPVAGDTAATFPAAAGESTAYAEATRPAWNEAAAVAGVVTNAASPATFTFNATTTLYGGALSSSSVKAGTAGVLVSAAKFSTAKGVDSGDIGLLTSSVTLISS